MGKWAVEVKMGRRCFCHSCREWVVDEDLRCPRCGRLMFEAMVLKERELRAGRERGMVDHVPPHMRDGSSR